MPVMIMSGALEQLVRPSSTLYLPLHPRFLLFMNSQFHMVIYPMCLRLNKQFPLFRVTVTACALFKKSEPRAFGAGFMS